MTISFSNFRQAQPPVILCVSDDTAYLNTIRRNLGEAGFSVIVSHAGPEAMDVATESNLDAILCDYGLQGMGALSIIEKLQELQGDEAAPALVLHDHYTKTLEQSCLSSGAVGLQVKTENLEELIGRVTGMLRDDGKQYFIEKNASRRRFKGGTDELTRIASKEHFARRFNGESAAAYRDQANLSLLICVIDNFEKLSEQHGKQKSDGVLAQVARLIEGELRSRDCVARYADHTFAVILPDTPIEAASAVGRRLRRRLSSSELGDLDHPMNITSSIGVTCRPPGTQVTTSELVAQALRASSGATMMGGDRVMADNALTGSPLVVVVGDPNSESGAVAAGLEECNVEVRIATSISEAQNMLEDVPIAMIVAHNHMTRENDGIDLLAWVRNRFPAIRRVLIADRITGKLMADAVNRSAIHFFIPVPLNLSSLPQSVDHLLFS